MQLNGTQTRSSSWNAHRHTLSIANCLERLKTTLRFSFLGFCCCGDTLPFQCLENASLPLMGLKKEKGKYGSDVGKEISSFPPTPKGALNKFFTAPSLPVFTQEHGTMFLQPHQSRCNSNKTGVYRHRSWKRRGQGCRNRNSTQITSWTSLSAKEGDEHFPLKKFKDNWFSLKRHTKNCVY